MNSGPGLALPLELQQSEFDESQAVELILEAGQISLHDAYIVHGSEANRSGKPRRGMTLRFMPTTSVYDRNIEAEQFKRLGDPDRPPQPLFLMRGIDQSGQNDFCSALGTSFRGSIGMIVEISKWPLAFPY